MTDVRGTPWHLVTAAVTAVALVLQLVLVVDGAAVLLPGEAGGLGTRLLHFVSYFTVLSNLLVLASTVSVLREALDRRLWRVVRLTALVSITVTGLVHWFLLRPLLDLHGASYLADKLLHVVVPLLFVVGWLVLGPRRRTATADVAPALAYPVLWLAYALVLGALTGWYPYPFVDAEKLGYARVALNCLGVAVLFGLVATAAVWGDRRLSRGRA